MDSQESINAKRVVLYFQVHQPRRLRTFSYFDIGSGDPYFNDEQDREIMTRIARECYLPANAILRDLIEKYPQIKVTFSISGSALDQMIEFVPEVIESFRDLVRTGSVEMLGETYYHSLAGSHAGDEFETQVTDHREKIKELFGVYPSFFRNTELIYDDSIGERVAALGFEGMFIEGVDQALNGNSTWTLYHHPMNRDFRLMPRSCGLSDDIGFRFGDGNSNLQVSDYLSWLRAIPYHDAIVTIGLDYETFGEHKKKETGILNFLGGLIESIVTSEDLSLENPSGIIHGKWTSQQLSIPNAVSWADHEKDLSAWLGNGMQQEANDLLFKCENELKSLDDDDVLKAWRYLQTSDHLYYLSTKKWADGSVHAYFSPYASPYEAFINYMNVLSDFEILIAAKKAERNLTVPEPSLLLESERRTNNPTSVRAEQIKTNFNNHP